MSMLASFNLRVQLFAGTQVLDAARDMCVLAGRLGVRIEADFNGIQLWARPGDDPAKLVAAFDEQVKRPAHLFRIAQAEQAQ